MDSSNYVVVITGAAGNIGSTLMFLLLEQNIFGEEKQISLRLVDLPQFSSKLLGLSLELQDCLFPRLKSVEVLPENKECFKDADCIILVGGKPRGLGMERRDLLEENARLFKKQAQLCDGVVKPTTKVLIVANPCNTNALVFSHFLPALDKRNITALSWLDQNRAKNFLACKLQVNSQKIKNVSVFGNHSNSMVVDYSQAIICDSETGDFPLAGRKIANKEEQTGGFKFLKSLLPAEYLQKDLQESVRKRGADIIHMKGTSSSFSAAKAIVDHLKAWHLGSQGEIVSMSVIVEGFGEFKERMCVSLPVVCSEGSFAIIEPESDLIGEGESGSMRRSLEELVAEKTVAFEIFAKDA